MFEHQPSRDGQPVVEERRIDSALEPLARIAGQGELLAGAGNMLGIEIGAFDQHLGGFGRYARMRAAHDPADIVDHRVVGDHRHRRVERVGLAVERLNLLAILRPARHQRPGQLGAVINVQGAAEIDRDEIGDVDQHRDRLLPDRSELAAHPFGRGAVGHARNGLRVKRGAAVRVERRDIGCGTGAGSGLERRHPVDFRERSQRAQPRSGEIAGDAAHPHAVLAVGGDRNIEHRVAALIVRKGHADRRIGWQLEDAVVLVAQFQLAHRTHHAVRRDPADCADFQFEAAAGHNRPGGAEHADHPRARIGRAADDLQRLAITRIDAEHLQLIGIGVAFGADHARHGKPGEAIGGVFQSFDLKPDRVEPCGNFRRARRSVEVLLEPAKRELHAAVPTPADRVGTSNGEKP